MRWLPVRPFLCRARLGSAIRLPGGRCVHRLPFGLCMHRLLPSALDRWIQPGMVIAGKRMQVGWRRCRRTAPIVERTRLGEGLRPAMIVAFVLVAVVAGLLYELPLCGKQTIVAFPLSCKLLRSRPEVESAGAAVVSHAASIVMIHDRIVIDIIADNGDVHIGHIAVVVEMVLPPV